MINLEVISSLTCISLPDLTVNCILVNVLSIFYVRQCIGLFMIPVSLFHENMMAGEDKG